MTDLTGCSSNRKWREGASGADLDAMQGAVRTYLSQVNVMGEFPVVLVEGGYFDRRRIEQTDRKQHLMDSFGLLYELQSQTKKRCKAFIQSALVNDFNGNEDDDCRLNVADQVSPIPNDGLRVKAVPTIPQWARELYDSYHHRSGKPRLQIFSMSTTRNRAARCIVGALKRTARDEGSVKVISDQGKLQIYAETEEGLVYLGHRPENEALRLTLRCTALMAQHYFDLFGLAHRIAPVMTDLWIFDFNRHLEGARVTLGAHASFSIHPWPRSIRVWIVNCIYAPPTGARTKLSITTWPL